jgi:transcriptional regulator with XRE-family HTH domain
MYQTNNRIIEQKALAKVICNIRKTNHLKREYLAELLNLSVGSIDKIEQGKTHLRFTDVMRLCDGLRISIIVVADAYKQALIDLSPATSP